LAVLASSPILGGRSSRLAYVSQQPEPCFVHVRPSAQSTRSVHVWPSARQKYASIAESRSSSLASAAIAIPSRTQNASNVSAGAPPLLDQRDSKVVRKRGLISRLDGDPPSNVVTRHHARNDGTR
jgi:hypothetical protein